MHTHIQGFICVNDTLESTNTLGVFAAGDCVHMVNPASQRPKAGMYAMLDDEASSLV